MTVFIYRKNIERISFIKQFMHLTVKCQNGDKAYVYLDDELIHSINKQLQGYIDQGAQIGIVIKEGFKPEGPDPSDKDYRPNEDEYGYNVAI